MQVWSTAEIRKGDELLIDYGEAFWKTFARMQTSGASFQNELRRQRSGMAKQIKTERQLEAPEGVHLETSTAQGAAVKTGQGAAETLGCSRCRQATAGCLSCNPNHPRYIKGVDSKGQAAELRRQPVVTAGVQIKIEPSNKEMPVMNVSPPVKRRRTDPSPDADLTDAPVRPMAVEEEKIGNDRERSRSPMSPMSDKSR